MANAIFTDYQNLKVLMDAIYTQTEALKNNANSIGSNINTGTNSSYDPSKMDGLMDTLFGGFEKLAATLSQVKENVNRKYFTDKGFEVTIN